MKSSAAVRIAAAVVSLFLLSCGRGPAPAPVTGGFIFGMLMVGPHNDRGWSQANYEAGRYVEKKLAGSRMLYADKVNPSDRPGTTAAQIAGDLAGKGARLLIFSSDDMKDDAVEFARAHPAIPVIQTSGDGAWREGREYKGLPNLANIMGRMEYGKMIAGYAAALATATGRIGYLGPLVNDETRRLAASAYLGARYCWEHSRGKKPKDLSFKVAWIGYWFNLPGVTSDPTQVAAGLYDSGCDVVISGIDTTEALAEALKRRGEGAAVWAMPYDYRDACAEAPSVCLGVPYFNWGPAYLRAVKAAREGTWKASFEWLPPDWADIDNPDSGAVGFRKGAAMDARVSAGVDRFIKELAGGLNLWTGPLALQDGARYVKAHEAAADAQVWYLPQLLEGMEGRSAAK